MKHISRISLMSLLLLVVNQSPIFAQSGCGLLDKSKPLLFISFERGVEGKNRDIRLRLNNNSTCTIVVDTYEEPPKQTLAELLHDSSVCKPSKFLELQNGAHVGMFYNVQFPKQNLTQAFGASDVITAATLQSGHSILFDVTLKSFK